MVLAAPEPAALGRLSAAVLRELLEHEGSRPQVIVPLTASGRGPRGISVHRSSDFTEEGIELVQGIRVTTVPRSLIDLSPQVRFERRRADFTFQEARLVIECDSRECHDNDFSFLDPRVHTLGDRGWRFRRRLRGGAWRWSCGRG